jgi:SAM-dependent methyltransferase
MPEVANPDQLAAWDGDEGAHWSTWADRYDASVRAHGRLLADAAAVAVDEHVLDLGCGCGASTRDAARAATAGAAVGVDLSTAMLEEARRRAAEEGLDNVTFVHADAQVHPFPPAAFDVVISRFGAMFFTDPVAAFTNVAGATRPGGRVALMTWQSMAGNEWITALRGALAQGRQLPVPPPNAPGPFGFADPDHVRGVLEAAGFDAVELAAMEAPFWVGADADDAFAFVRTIGVVQGLVRDLAPDQQRAALDDVRQALDDHAGPDGVVFDSRIWLVRAAR